MGWTTPCARMLSAMLCSSAASKNRGDRRGRLPAVQGDPGGPVHPVESVDQPARWRCAAGEGVTDFTPYRVDPSVPLMPDFFVPADSKPPQGVKGGM